MPRKAKEKEEIITVENKIDKSKPKKTNSKSANKSVAKKSSTTSKKVTEKKAASKSTKKATSISSKKTTTTKKRNSTKKEKVEIIEYYDLPYRYNQTIVRILAQTPNTMFVYWDISDEDKEKYIKQYGEFFFNDTKPILIVHNKTKNTSFEVEINDYANSWYLHLLDSNCDYRVELGRRPINEYAKIDDFLYVSSSNDTQFPNDHILFDSINKNIYFKNLKTNKITKKDISLSFLTKIGKIYNIQEFYEKMYPNEDIRFGKINSLPSSSR